MGSPSLGAHIVPVTFNVQESTGTTYKAYIERLRRCFPTINVPPTQDPLPRPVLETVLRTSSHAIKLSLYYNGLSLHGYKVEGSDQWWELGYSRPPSTCSDPPGLELFDFAPHQNIAGSSFLELARQYKNWEHVIGREWTMDSIILGQSELTTAVNLLATSTSRQERAWSLMVVSLMIPEGFRFNCVSDFVAHHAFLGSSTPPPWMRQLVQRNDGQRIGNLVFPDKRIQGPVHGKWPTVPDIWARE